MIRRFFTRILLVVLIACCGYNWLQVQRLQAEVRDLNGRIAKQTAYSEQTAHSKAPSPWLDRSDGRVRAAREALAHSDWPTAERELKQTVADLKNAMDATVQSPQSRRSLRSLQNQTKEIDDRVNILWHRVHSNSSRHSP